jgi:ribosomal protein L11 methylase PrmA
VLAIAASLLGADTVTGDDDADATRTAWDNLALNPSATVTLLTGDFRSLGRNGGCRKRT